MSAAVNVTNGGSTTAPANNLPGNGRTIASLVLDDRLGHTREVGNQATWSLSSCKPGIKIWLSVLNNLASLKILYQIIK